MTTIKTKFSFLFHSRSSTPAMLKTTIPFQNDNSFI